MQTWKHNGEVHHHTPLCNKQKVMKFKQLNCSNTKVCYTIDTKFLLITNISESIVDDTAKRMTYEFATVFSSRSGQGSTLY